MPSRETIISRFISSYLAAYSQGPVRARQRFWVTKDNIWSAVEITLEFIS